MKKGLIHHASIYEHIFLPLAQMMPNLAAAYARVSTGMQVEAGSSLPSQLAEIRRYAEGNGYQIAAEFIDEGESARTADRPEFQRMIALAKSRNVPWKAIITWKNSRFARSREDSIIYKALLRRHGVSLLFAGEPNMDDSPTGRLMEAIIEAIDEFYSLNLAQEVLRGSKEAAQQGYALGGSAPWGMRKIQVQNEHGRMKWKYAPGEDAELVREVYRRYASGWPLEPLCAWLNEIGAKPPRRNGKWTPGQIWNVLFRYQQVYLGHVIYNKTSREGGRNGKKHFKSESEWSICRGAHEAVITQELAEAVNLARAVKPINLNLNYKTRNAQVRLLSGLVTCQTCGGKYSIGTSVKRGIKRLYYRCPKMGACANRWIRCEAFEEAVRKSVLEQIGRASFFEEAFEEIEKRRKSGEKEVAKQRGGLERQRGNLAKKRERLIEAIAEGVIKRDEAAHRLEAIRLGIDDIDSKLSVPVEEETANQKDLLYGVHAVLEDTEITDSALRAMLISTVDHITVSHNTVNLSWKLPIQDLTIKI